MFLLPIMLIGLAVGGYFVLKPPEQLPLSQADGIYANSCCGTLVLKGGRGTHGGAAFDYVIEQDKMGPFVLPKSRLVTVDDASRLVIVQDEPPLMLRLETSMRPQWIDIPGFGKSYRFARQP